MCKDNIFIDLDAVINMGIEREEFVLQELRL